MSRYRIGLEAFVFIDVDAFDESSALDTAEEFKQICYGGIPVNMGRPGLNMAVHMGTAPPFGAETLDETAAPVAEGDWRLSLAAEIYRLCYANTESFEEQHIGVDLAYLLGAIATDGEVSWPDDRPILKVLPKDRGHVVWKYITDDEGNILYKPY
jgi:hypothetical protein